MTFIRFHHHQQPGCGPDGSGLVEGTAGNDLIDIAYTGDPEGDRIDHSDALLPGEAPQDDIVLAGAGNDTVRAGLGNDEIYGGTGNDALYGEAGDDVAYGEAGNDALYGGDGNDVLHGDGGYRTHRESFEWSKVADTDACGSGNVDDGESLSGDTLVQDTGDVKVTVIIPKDSATRLNSTFETERVNIDGIDGAGLNVNACSSLDSYDRDGDGEAHYQVNFDQAVANVQFRVSDIDANRGQVTIHAWDVNGNPVNVHLNGGSGLQMSDTDGVAGNDTALGTGNGSPTSGSNSMLVEIDGPVSKIEIIHENVGTGGSAVNISDIFFDAIGGENTGDDYLDGGKGDDTLYGDGGNDILVGGEGADRLYGGDGKDILKANLGDQHVDGGSGGNDYDTLDLTGQGPIRVINLTADGNGNGYDGTVQFIAADGSVSGSLNFTEIEEIRGEYYNGAPVACDDTATTAEDTSASINVLANDNDPEGGPLTVVSASAEHGVVTIGSDGKLTYTPDANYNGEDSITYVIEDDHGLQASANVAVTITPVNDVPDAADDHATTDEDTPVAIDVLANDKDVDGDTLSVTSASAENGTVTIASDGKLIYTPDENFNGTDTITYAVSDGNGGSDSAHVAVSVCPVNDDPVAVDDVASVDYGTPTVIAVLLNDYDVDGDALHINGIPVALHGSVSVNPDGTLTYTPEAGYSGADTISYEISDGNGGFDTAIVDVTVGAAPLDGIVEGTAGDDVIDIAYTGDPQGDRVDHGDAILPTQGPDDDIIYAYGGDDLIKAGEGNDTVFGGDGNDTIHGEAGKDFIDAGDGSDVVYGGDGNDTIVTGDCASNLPDRGYPGLYPADPDPFNDRDTVYGGAGADIILTGDDNDLIYGGTGNDVIDGGIDDDEIHGDEGNDSIIGGEGSDTIYGGDGDDRIWGGLGPLLPDALNIRDDQGDLRPDNGRDLIYGGAGNDTIHGQDDDDTIYGDDGDDFIDGGIDNDRIYGGTGADHLIGGQGDDRIEGGDGNDLIDGGDGNDTIYGDDGDDTIYGGDGDDYINGGKGTDTIYGGAGNDTILGMEGADRIYGGDGEDFIIASEGNDVIYGGAGNDNIEGAHDDDLIYGDEGDDFVKAGEGNDTVYGGDGNDTLYGDHGDDSLHGGDGDDYLRGDSGNDSFYGGAGADRMLGQDDRDTFYGGTAGDRVDGGEGGDDYDVLDLSGAGPLKIIYDQDNPENGTVEFRNSDGHVTGTMEFKNIENVIPCFTPGTMIATPKGERPVEELKVGDRVITRDNGIQEIRWIGSKALDWRALGTQPHLRPILIRSGSLGHGLPERDMLVSPNHRVLVANDQTQLYFEEREVLVAAKHLVSNEGVSVAESLGATYIHFMFDHHEVVLSDGAWTESFQPGDYTLKGIGNSQRAEILGLFPELKDRIGLESYASARRTLKKHEAKMLWK